MTHSTTRTYLNTLTQSFSDEIIAGVESLSKDLRKAWAEKRQVFICGNGGSAANALHIANDFHYGIGCGDQGKSIPGIRVNALPSNTGILTCLANDTGYENIYSNQLDVLGNKDDLLIVLSGSGNSPNIVNALEKARELGIRSYAILAFSGGKCKHLADCPIHFPVDDMQIAEDTQLIIGHICMQWLNKNKPESVI